ncbi:MAG: hypothetical protein ACYDFQ_11785, partial [Vulcanimicrobiaceae bacterium]
SAEKADWVRKRAQFSRRFPGVHRLRGAHVAVAMGGDRKAAMRCMIAANNCREIATSAPILISFSRRLVKMNALTPR